MSTSPPRLQTTGVIAEKLDVPLHRVLHVLATRGHIRPAARAGILRLYDNEAVEKIRQELESIEAIRQLSGKGGSV